MSFQTIKQAAIHLNRNAIERIIVPQRSSTLSAVFNFLSGPRVGECIDVRHQKNPYLTPAGDLAREGNLAAVEFLRNYGASINEIAYGFALGGNLAMVERYREEYGANPDAIALGFAQGGDLTNAKRYVEQYGASMGKVVLGLAFVDKLELLGDLHLMTDRMHAPSAAIGYGLAGNVSKINYYRLEQPYKHHIVEALACGGHFEQVNEYQRRGASVNCAAKGYARSNYKDKVEEYGGALEDYSKYIAIGLAQGGHAQEAEFYRLTETDSVAYGFALGGHVREAERYRITYGATTEAITNGFSAGGYTDHAGRYLNRQAFPLEITHAMEGLERYVTTFKQKPIVIIADYPYPPELICSVSKKPPSIPVRIMGYGPFDYDAILAIPETPPHSGIRVHPLFPEVRFDVRDIAPDFVARDTLNNINIAAESHAAHVNGSAESVPVFEPLKTYVTKPIPIDDKAQYPKDIQCPISLDTPSIPVRIMGYGPFDYNFIKHIAETPAGSGKRKHPMFQGVTFEYRDIAPDFVTRDVIIKCNEACNNKNQEREEEPKSKPGPK